MYMMKTSAFCVYCFCFFTIQLSLTQSHLTHLTDMFGNLQNRNQSRISNISTLTKFHHFQGFFNYFQDVCFFSLLFTLWSIARFSFTFGSAGLRVKALLYAASAFSYFSHLWYNTAENERWNAALLQIGIRNCSAIHNIC